MGAASSLPHDALGHCASWVASKRSILRLRAVSTEGLGAARRAIASRASRRLSHVRIGKIKIAGAAKYDTDPRTVEALGRVFGAGCNSLQVNEMGSKSFEFVDAVRFFVARTNGGLRKLEYDGVPAAALVMMCQASPRLKKVSASLAFPSDAEMRAIAAACPELDDVDVGNSEFSSAETWQRHFPKLRRLALSHRIPLYTPTRLDVISEAARTTDATLLDVGGCHIERDVIDAVVGTPLGDRIEYFGFNDSSDETKLEREAVLAAARGFPRLRHLVIPEGSTMGGPGFYEELARARPNLKRLSINCDASTTDACIAAACAHLSLEILELEGCPALSRFADGILAGDSAATLISLVVTYCASESERGLIIPYDVLRIVRGCPNLIALDWYQHEPPHAQGWDEITKEITELLTSRGGRVQEEWPRLTHTFSEFHSMVFKCAQPPCFFIGSAY